MLFSVVTLAKENWQRVGDTRWGTRSHFATATTANGTTYVFGGSNGQQLHNDVWKISANVSESVEVVNHANWTKRKSFGAAAYRDGSLLIFGGTDGNFLFFNDVWFSKCGVRMGIEWEKQVIEGPRWSGRAAFATVVLSDDSVLIIGGCCHGAADVWRSPSASNGKSWTRQIDNAEWGPRMGSAALALPHGEVMLMGGRSANEPKYFNDAWLGTDAGSAWELVTESAPWPARSEFAAVALDDGSIIICCGRLGSGAMGADVWRSHILSLHSQWAEEVPALALNARADFGFVPLFGSGILLFGGQGCNDSHGCGFPLDDVFRREYQCHVTEGPDHGSMGACIDYLDSGSRCQPDCDEGYVTFEDSSCTDGVLSHATCAPKNCTEIDPPPNANMGDCLPEMFSDSACQVECFDGYLVGGNSYCYLGVMTHSVCIPKPCFRADTTPENGLDGDCPDLLKSGEECQPDCYDGYTVNGVATCFLGNLVFPDCLPDPCNMTAPMFGQIGDDCQRTDNMMVSGDSCLPECDKDHILAGATTCQAGNLELGLCLPPPCDLSGFTVPNGERGTCLGKLEPGKKCAIVCHDSFTPNGTAHCGLDGVFLSAKCVPKPCDLSSLGDLKFPVPESCQPLAIDDVCRPECETGYSPTGIIYCDNGTAGFMNEFGCAPAACPLAPDPIPIAELGDCPRILKSGMSCGRNCTPGHSALNDISCFLGQLTAAPCTEDPCEMDRIDTLPQHGDNFGCPLILPSGQSCLPNCNVGHELESNASCYAGNVTPGTCRPVSCRIGEPLDGAGIGNCPDVLASGEDCTFSCGPDENVSGPTKCEFGVLTPGTCSRTTPWAFRFTVSNLDVGELAEETNVLDALAEVMQLAIARRTQGIVEPSDIAVFLASQSGSTRVFATVYIRDPNQVNTVDFILRSWETARKLDKELQEVVPLVSGTDNAISGSISLSNIEVQGEHINHGSGNVHVVSSSEDGTDVGIVILFSSIALLTGICCACVISRYLKHKGGPQKDTASAAEGYPEAIGAWMWPIGYYWSPNRELVMPAGMPLPGSV